MEGVESTHLHSLLFGQDALAEDITRWRDQKLVFAESFPFLIEQHHGGPCGVLAPIQAFLINKIDLLANAEAEESGLYREFLAAYEPLGYPILSLSSETKEGIESLRSLLQNKTTSGKKRPAWKESP